MQPLTSQKNLAVPCRLSHNGSHDLLSKSLLKSAPLLLPHASAVAFFFMALLMARPFIAAFFITLLAFLAFMAFIAFIAFIAFMATMTQRARNAIGGQEAAA